MTSAYQSTCENPTFPNWMWRYNRNKKLSPFDAWYTRAERWPPRYRNMGMNDNFRFHPIGPDEEYKPFQHLGVNYAHDLVESRETGFGNAALGNPPGPAPPRLVIYDVQGARNNDDLYKVNEINNITPGMSLLDYTYLVEHEDATRKQPLNPRQYLDKTLNQIQEFPGTFPHFNAPIPSNSKCEPRVCMAKTTTDFRDPMKIWKDRYRTQLMGHARDKGLSPDEYLPPLFDQPCKRERKPTPDYESMRPPEYGVGPNKCPSAVRRIY